MDAQLREKEIQILQVQELFDTTKEKLDEETLQHNATKTQLDDTTQSLTLTRDHLGHTRTRLAERGSILTEHEITEVGLLAEANRLLSMLAGTISDIDGLSAKIGE